MIIQYCRPRAVLHSLSKPLARRHMSIQCTLRRPHSLSNSPSYALQNSKSSSTQLPTVGSVSQSRMAAILPSPSAPDLLPRISSHPALRGIQLRCGPRDTYRPCHRIRKRRHGFLAKLRTRGGRNTLKRRRARGRASLSH